MTASTYRAMPILTVALSICLACTPGQKPDPVIPKYRLSDCLVQIDYLWSDATSIETRNKVDFAVFEKLKEFSSSGEYPMFSGHSANGASYLRLYFADKCEDRLELTAQMANHLREEIAGFPEYIVRVDGIVAGDDGTVPTGWWLDE